MSEGRLYASTNSGSYAIGNVDGPDIKAGQAINILLGGHWIAGHIAYGSGGLDPSAESAANGIIQNVEGSQVSIDDSGDMVTEASEESFPASDPPSWTATRDRTPPLQDAARVVNGYYFIADADSSICGLCIGMQVRTR